MELDKIIKGCLEQKSIAQKQLYEQFKTKLFTICFKYSNSFEDAEDNLHNTFIEIFKNIDKYSGKGSFEGWMKRIAINKSIENYKKTFHLTPLKELEINDTINIEQQEINNIELMDLMNIIKELPNQYRIVFTLYELDNYSHREISEILSISINSSKSNLSRAKTLLKTKIQNFNSSSKIIKYGEK